MIKTRARLRQDAASHDKLGMSATLVAVLNNIDPRTRITMES